MDFGRLFLPEKLDRSGADRMISNDPMVSLSPQNRWKRVIIKSCVLISANAFGTQPFNLFRSFCCEGFSASRLVSTLPHINKASEPYNRRKDFTCKLHIGNAGKQISFTGKAILLQGSHAEIMQRARLVDRSAIFVTDQIYHGNLVQSRKCVF